MKILHVITSLEIGGAEKLIVDILPMFRECGHEVEVAIFYGAETPFKKELEDKKIKVHSFGLGSVYNLLHVLRLRKLINSFDIVHTHNFTPQYYTVFAKLLSFSKVKLVTTEHSTHNRRRDKALFKLIEPFVYNQYDKIICISKKAEENLTEYLGSTSGVLTINNGINTQAFQEAMPANLLNSMKVAEDAKIIMQVAGFRKAKDQDCVIRSLKHLPENVVAVFVGDGERRSKCEELAKELGVAKRVFFLGVRSDIPALLKRSDIVVMSSHWEGLSLSSVEGMAAGKPMIASDVEGLREVVGGAGLLFEKSNEKELAKHINELLSNADYYEMIVKRCEGRSKDYDIKTMVDGYENVYKELFG